VSDAPEDRSVPGKAATPHSRIALSHLAAMMLKVGATGFGLGVVGVLVRFKVDAAYVILAAGAVGFMLEH